MIPKSFTVAHSLRVPTAYVWIYTARLVTGQGLPAKVPEWALGAALLFSLTTVLRIWLNTQPPSRRKFSTWIPGGIAVAVGTFTRIYYASFGTAKYEQGCITRHHLPLHARWEV